MNVTLRRPLLLLPALSLLMTGSAAPPAQAARPKVKITLKTLDPKVVPSGGQAALTVQVKGRKIVRVNAQTLAASGLPSTTPVPLTSSGSGLYSGTLTAPVNPTAKAVSVPVRVTVRTRNGKKKATVVRLTVQPQGNAGGGSILPLVYSHVRDSGGGAPGQGVQVLLAFEPKGVAQLYVARADDAIARRGTYAYAGGKLTLKFTADDFKPNVNFPLSLSQDTVSMPFQAFDTKAGTSTWKRLQPSLTHNLMLLFKAISIGEELPAVQAIARVKAYADAVRTLQGQVAGPRASGLFDGLFASPLTKVEAKANGVRLTYANDPAVDVILFSWANGDGKPLQLSPLAGDPRVHLDPIAPHNGTFDPREKTALFVAPFKDLQSFAWYDFYYLNKFTSIPTSKGYHLEGSFNFKFDEMEDVLDDRGYKVQRLENADATVVALIRALKPGAGRASAPGFIVFNTHGESGGNMSTGLLMGDDSGGTGKWPAEIKALKAAGFGDLLTYDGGTENAPKTLEVMTIERDLKPGSYSYFLALTPKFWEWLRVKQGADFSRSLFYAASCLTDATPDLRESIRARAHFAFNKPAVPEVAGAIFQYFCRSLSRYSHSAEESYYNILRVANTRQMIYQEDKVFDGLLYENARAQQNVLMDVFKGYGWDGSKLVGYQDAGWLKSANTDPGAVWWMLFAGRWGQNVDGGWQNLRGCWTDHWSKGSTGGLADPFCQNASPGRVPTQQELGYTLYLLKGEAGPFATGTKVPRWTLSDGD